MCGPTASCGAGPAANPPLLPPPPVTTDDAVEARDFTMKAKVIPMAVITAAMVKPFSLKRLVIFSLQVKSSSSLSNVPS